MLTSSFTGWSNYMMDFGQMLQDGEAMKSWKYNGSLGFTQENLKKLSMFQVHH